MPDEVVLVEKESKGIDKDTLVKGGVIVGIGALIYFLFFSRGSGWKFWKTGDGSGGYYQDTSPLLFVMIRPTTNNPSDSWAFYGAHTKKGYTYKEMVSRIKEGKRNDVSLSAAGTVRQGSYIDVITQLRNDGIVALEKQ